MSKFEDAVFAAIKLIPKGKVASYGQIALMAGIPRAARQVGWVLHSSNNVGSIPWWRVINNVGRISIKNEEHLPEEQKKLLEGEGIKVGELFEIDIEKYRFRPDPEALQKLKLDDEYVFMLMEKYGV